MEGVTIAPNRSIRYLGILMDDRLSFGKHIEAVAHRAEERISSLTRILPNIGGPNSCKRAVLCSAFHNMILYGAPVWKKAISTKKTRVLLNKAQRNILLRVASAFRTTSGVALQVITGIVPIDLMITERNYIYENSEEDQSIKKRRARERTLIEWQTRWENKTAKAQWIKRLISDINE